MEIRKLDVFCNVVELKSFTRTAESVLLSQPTVSEHIRNLENELGHKLIDRMGRKAVPTPAGRLLYGYAKKMIRLQQDALQAVEQYSGTLSGKLNIGGDTTSGTYRLPKLINNFREEYDSVSASLRITSSRQITREVIEGNLEVGIVGAQWNKKTLDWIELFSDELCLIFAPDHKWASKEYVTPQELVEEPFILRETSSGTRRAVEQILADHDCKLANTPNTMEIESTAAVKEAVKAGLGVSIVSKLAVADDLRQNTLLTKPVKGIDFEQTFYIITRKNKELSPLASMFIEYLKKETLATA